MAQPDDSEEADTEAGASQQHTSLKHHLLGPSLTKSGQEGVDLRKVSDIIYEASKGSKFFQHEQARDRALTARIDGILRLKAQLDGAAADRGHEERRADDYMAELELSRDLSQHIVHIDCDAFYAAVEEIERPELRRVPMAVGGGVLTTCNYEARKFGCRSAMAGFVARKLCPQLVCLLPNFDKYAAKAGEVRAILARYDADFESSSIDEAYLNITPFCRAHGREPDDVVAQVRRDVHEQCGVTVSAGIAPNAKLAKICSNRRKPDGQYRLANERAAVMAFMRDLPVRRVNGVGRVLERQLDAIGIRTCGDIYAQRAYLRRLFGDKTFHFLLQTYLGLGRTDVRPAAEHERKSVGTESTFRDTGSRQELRDRLRQTADELEADLQRAQVRARTVCLKVKLHTYEVLTRQVQLARPVCRADDLYGCALPLLARLEKELPGMKIRLMGLRCTHLVSTVSKDGGGQDFFRPRTAALPSTTGTDEGAWEAWPDAEFEAAARQERQEEMAEMERLSQECADEAEPAPAPPFWDCPVCGLAQPATDHEFNGHIDSCLSRQTIREAVAETLSASASGPKKRKGGAAGDAPRQKKLFFA